jgi:ABC-type branched-subunit amino acid transport system ATPase component
VPISKAESGRPDGVLVVDDLVVGYGGPPIVRGISARVGEGEIATIVGPNGAGKSTLLKAIAGLLSVEGGKVRLTEQDITNVKSHRLARIGIGYVPQNDDVFEPLTVRENLEMGGYLLSRHKVRERIDAVVAVLPAIGRLMDRRAAKLSGGERKMVAIGRALMAEPRVLLLDEPTSGLSAERSAQLLTRDIRGLAGTGTSILLVEQKALSALEISHWGYVLALGKVVLTSSAPELLARSDLGDVFLGKVAQDPPAGEAGVSPVRQAPAR